MVVTTMKMWLLAAMLFHFPPKLSNRSLFLRSQNKPIELITCLVEIDLHNNFSFDCWCLFVSSLLISSSTMNLISVLLSIFLTTETTAYLLKTPCFHQYDDERVVMYSGRSTCGKGKVMATLEYDHDLQMAFAALAKQNQSIIVTVGKKCSFEITVKPNGMNKTAYLQYDEYKSTDATAFQFTLHDDHIRLLDSHSNQSVCSVDQPLASTEQNSTRTVVVGVKATGDAKIILKLKSVNNSGSAGKITLISQSLSNDARQLKFHAFFFLFFALLIL
ncbi:hypothetical protein M3Y95_01231700 [Aphelenchoides besseyi]|nr:hypothetical protein M3Y95_01231700 [Aphelenchoides besseyi]